MSVEPGAIATAVVEMARAGRFAEIEKLFAPRLRAVVSAESLRVAWVAEAERFGAIRGVGEPSSEPTDAALVRVSVPVTGERGGMTVVMSVDAAGLLNGFRLAPPPGSAWEAPSYAESGRFTEYEITLGEGRLAVSGTVSVPRGRGAKPGVVLLSGGGPFDRDETSGPNKPLKDLAWGLASRGIAVARFDLVTYTHPGLAADLPEFTMTDEYVPYAVAAIQLLQQHPAVDPARVFVLGHSMGGKVAPRVAAAEPSVAGLVLLAADASPMQRSAVRVARYLAALNPGAATESAVAMITEQAERVDSPGLSVSTPAADLPFGLPGAYWLDLRGYDPVSTAAALNKPMLILQGARDYQVTVEDDLALWQAGLGERPEVTIGIHDAGNHLFFPGSGASSPAEYEPAQHIDPAVIAQIADWLAPAPVRGRVGRLLSSLSRR
ncbi:alpha/beta fold hydrolase [Nocardia sp. NPDC006630]|uniref:alpha/beta hydrolase n=1 Tax=Nocardia sp. NPDC006630 TaxID=3157181 RepID=UPI0033A424DA